MTLRLHQPGAEPLGQYDGYDSEVLSFLGGEVCTLTAVAVGGADAAAADADGSDGYVGIPPAHVRPAVTRTLVSGARPLYLADDGTAGDLFTRGYGTLFGRVVGGTTGQQSTGGAVLGPHTAVASGKITLWAKPGHYGVTLDAVDTTAATGLVVNHPTLTVGDPLFATAAGLLTPNAAASFEAGLVVARFVEFATEQTLVTTPVSLASALNSPPGNPAQQQRLTQAVFQWNPPIS